MTAVLGLRIRVTTCDWGRAVSVASATIGALLFAIAAYTPWFVGVSSSGSTLALNGLVGLPQTPMIGSSSLMYEFARRASEAIDYIFCSWTVAGFLMSPLLWRPSRAMNARVGYLFFCGWMGLTTVGCFALAGAALYQVGWTRVAYYHFARVEFQWGFWLTLLSLLLMFPIILSILLRPRSGAARSVADSLPFSVRTPHLQSRWQRIGATACSLGLLLFGLGFFALPWASTGCATPTLSLNTRNVGACFSMDAAGVMGRELDLGLFPFNSNATVLLSLYLVLAYGIWLSLLGIWRPAIWREYYLWTAMLLVIAVASAVYADICAHAVVRSAPILGSLTPRVWYVDVGVPMAYAGLILACLSFGALILFGRGARKASGKPQPQPSVA